MIILVSCLSKDIFQGDCSNTTFAELWGWLAVGYKVNLADQSGDTFTDLVASIVLPNENAHSYLLSADRYMAQQESAQHLYLVNQACRVVIKGLGEPCRIMPGPLLLVFFKILLRSIRGPSTWELPVCMNWPCSSPCVLCSCSNNIDPSIMLCLPHMQGSSALKNCVPPA